MNLFRRAWRAALASRPERAVLTPAAALDLAASELRRAPSSYAEIAVVLVDGRSGSGKTEFAAELSRRCPTAQVLHLDDLYPDWNGLESGVKRAQELVRAWSYGDTVQYEPTQWLGMPPRPRMALDPDRSLIVEGVGARHCLPAPDNEIAALPLYLDVPTARRRDRALARDGQAYAPHWETWAAQEETDLQCHPVDTEHSDIYVCRENAPSSTHTKEPHA